MQNGLVKDHFIKNEIKKSRSNDERDFLIL